MLLNVYTLPQLAVSAKLLCLLMVVICGAVPSMVRSVKLYNQCSSRYVRVDMKGQVFADSDNISDQLQNLTIRSTDFDMKLSIFAEKSKMFLCFNKMWKLRGYKKFKGERCYFKEDMDPEESGYNRYRSVANEAYFVGFNPKGRPLKWPPGRNGLREKCINFIKEDRKFNVDHHNTKVSGGNQSSEFVRLSENGMNKHRHGHHRQQLHRSHKKSS